MTRNDRYGQYYVRTSEAGVQRVWKLFMFNLGSFCLKARLGYKVTVLLEQMIDCILERFIVTKPLKNCRSRRFIRICRKTSNLTSVTSFQATFHALIISILILFFHLRLSLPSRTSLFSCGCPIKMFISAMRASCLAHLVL
jgi:hypothetical protein